MRMKTMKFATLGLGVLIYAAGVGVYARHSHAKARADLMREIDSRLLAAAEGVPYALGERYHDAVTDAAATGSEPYADTVLRLSRYAADQRVKYVYTMIRPRGQILFSSSSATPEELKTGDYSGYLEAYDEASPGCQRSFASTVPVFDEYTDKWGTVRSVFVPRRSPSGRPYVVGADLDIGYVHGKLREQLNESLVTAAAFFGLIVPFLAGAGWVAHREAQFLELEVAARTLEVRQMNESLEARVREEIEKNRAKDHHLIEKAREEGEREQARRAALESHVAEVAAAMEQMAATALDVAQNTAKTSQCSGAAAQTVAAVQGAVRESADAMGRVAAAVHSAGDVISRLGERSAKIREIVTVIDDIADQTNLLALNAAIEAARAGDHGRGFAVVADEVRKLAERTGRATDEIEIVIRSILSETQVALASAERSRKEVELGEERTRDTEAALEGIVQETAAVREFAAQIAVASEQQAHTAREITGRLTGIAGV